LKGKGRKKGPVRAFEVMVKILRGYSRREAGGVVVYISDTQTPESHERSQTMRLET
jgi:hypothetical protein